ncbi:lipid II:glycine glycyltransferase FemX [Arthrobacter glacialis]|uniref:Methicillin resistance protein n=1 Tax=Arthrobacter glacialis TaxID=1664 RepID=A0A2S3ZZZ7_ARTGL|nr:peptidoglycan bridge formation glycyltransferase FemA/FemB family protein [Arthrobacter glacialis]POH74831.1 methicillin resistance protein [Arthrobacter glacialis]
MTLNVVPCRVRDEWDAAVDSQQGHPMQLWGWGETKAAHNWRVDRVLVLEDGAVVGSAQILLRPLPFPFRSLAYIARGPQSAAGREIEVLDAVGRYVKATHKSVALSIEPDWDADSVAAASLPASGWARSSSTILIPRTLILDLSRSEDELLGAMSKKTRQYIRKSSREALEYRAVTAAELPQCMAVYKETAERAEFGIHQDSYYSDILRNLGAGSPIYGAFDGEKLVAFLWLAASGSTAFELYGGMTEAGSQLRANFSLKWLAIQEMKARGITRYDFNGLLNDGVSKFKFGFADHENMLAGTWDLGLSPLYPVFAKALPLGRKAMKKARGILKR